MAASKNFARLSGESFECARIPLIKSLSDFSNRIPKGFSLANTSEFCNWKEDMLFKLPTSVGFLVCVISCYREEIFSVLFLIFFLFSKTLKYT